MDGILAVWITDLLTHQFWLTSPVAWIAYLFQLWMLIDAIRRQEWMWVVFIIIFPLINAALYFFLVYRSASGNSRPFELPGSSDRRRIKELQAQIHHLDKAHHHAQLGDVYFRQGRFQQAESCYRNALEREPDDSDAIENLGQCLLRLGKPADALPLLEKVCRDNPKHNYGYSLMALAEGYSALGRNSEAVQTWEMVTENYSYSRARVELAQLYLKQGKTLMAQAKLKEALADDLHAPAFERRQERIWIKRARKLLTQMPSATR